MQTQSIFQPLHGTSNVSTLSSIIRPVRSRLIEFEKKIVLVI
jgi:hypothetical protein